MRGAITLCGTDGEVVDDGETRLALCRCGATGNAPYCDNSHRAVGFKDKPSETRDGSLPDGVTGGRVQPNDPGPFVISGAVRVTTAAGTVLAESDEVALCHCGRSGSKPFCDGSHNRQD